jgi:hypothetical protein
MNHRAALLALDIRVPLTYSLIWSLLTNPLQPNFKGKKYFHKMLKRALMTKMMTKAWLMTKMMKKEWLAVPKTNEMRVRILCVCRNGAANGNPCLLYWYKFLVHEQFFVCSRELWRKNENYSLLDDILYRKLLKFKPETSRHECVMKANYAYNTCNIDEAIRLFALVSRF